MLSSAIVTGADPLYDVPDSPVPIVSALDAVAVTVTDPPNDTDEPLIVIELFVNPLFGIVVLIALAGILIVVLLAAVSWPCA